MHNKFRNRPDMRIIVYGVGAIGGTVAAALSLSGREVVGIARGKQFEAIRTDGLRLRSPTVDRVARFPCVSDPIDMELDPYDLVLLAMKSQDTLSALERLRDAGLDEQPVFCLQNGVANERQALRRFPNVHCATVMIPSLYRIPGEVAAFCAPILGFLDFGRYPSGSDDALAEALEVADIEPFVSSNVMAGKFGKLLVNLANVIQAALDEPKVPPELAKIVRAEGARALEAAGIDWVDVMNGAPDRRELILQREVDGVENVGWSTRQSLLRGAESVKTDYLNGEIVLLGRLHGVPTSLNASLTRLGRKLAADGAGPGRMSRAELENFLES